VCLVLVVLCAGRVESHAVVGEVGVPWGVSAWDSGCPIASSGSGGWDHP
jgi:hypothetical protein